MSRVRRTNCLLWPIAGVCCGFASLLLVIAGSVGGAVAADSITLTFGWPHDLRGRAEFSDRREKGVGENARVVRIVGSYSFETAPVADGIVISFGDPRVQIDGGDADAAGQAKLQEFLTRSMSIPPSFVVDRAGDYVRLEGIDAYREAQRSAFVDLLGDVPDASRQLVLRLFEATMSEQQLEAGIVESWYREVGGWIGAELDQGETYEATFTDTVPMLGNAEIPMRAEVRFLGRVPCADGATTSACADLEMVSSVDPDALAQVLEDFVRGLSAGSEAAPRVETLKFDTTVRLVTEPDTLLPHRSQTKKVTSIVISQDGKSHSSGQIQETEYRYEYLPR